MIELEKMNIFFLHASILIDTIKENVFFFFKLDICQ